MSYIPPSGSVLSFQGTDPWVVTGSIQGVSNQSVSGTIDIGVVPGSVLSQQFGTRISSVISSTPSSMLVGASIIGLTPVTITGNPSISGTVDIGNTPQASVHGEITVLGSVLVTQGTDPWIITGSVQGSFSPAGNQSVSGTVDVVQSTNPWIITGSVQGAFSPSGNQSVSGTVDTIQSGTVISSIASTVPSSVLVGASIFGQLPAGTAVLGSVATLQGTNPWRISSVYGNVSGSVLSQQLGTVRASVISSTPSSMLAGASIYGQLPAGTAVLGSIAVLQAKSPFDIAGSVLATQGTNPWVVSSVITTNTVPGTPFRYSGSLVSGSVTLIAASVSGKSHYITDFRFINTGSVATVITLKDGSASIVGYTVAPATGGSNMPNMMVPDKANAAQDLTYQMSPSVSILYATVKGYTL